MAKGFLDRENFINYVDEKDKLFEREKNYFSVVWEKCLTSDYWKSWREKIRTLSSEEVGFFMDRVQKLRSRILWIIRSYKKEKWNDDYARKLFEINEKELENVTKKEFYENKPKNGVRELTSKEVGDMLDKDQLISEINRLKVENQALKNNQTLTNSEKEVKLNENKQRLEQLKGFVESDNSNIQSSEQNKFPTGWVVGSGALVIVGITAFLVSTTLSKKKNQKKNLYSVKKPKTQL
jgi:hypothetical protein